MRDADGNSGVQPSSVGASLAARNNDLDREAAARDENGVTHICHDFTVTHFLKPHIQSP